MAAVMNEPALVVIAASEVPVPADARAPCSPIELRDVECEEHVRRAQAGSAESFNWLMEHYGGRVYGYLRQMTGNSHDAEDLTQDTFLKAYRALPRCHHLDRFLPWLLTIARRTALNHFRGLRVTEEIMPESQVEWRVPAQLATVAEEQGQLWTLARTLKKAYFEVLRSEEHT